jgi:hypothetical protein
VTSLLCSFPPTEIRREEQGRRVAMAEEKREEQGPRVLPWRRGRQGEVAQISCLPAADGRPAPPPPSTVTGGADQGSGASGEPGQASASAYWRPRRGLLTPEAQAATTANLAGESAFALVLLGVAGANHSPGCSRGCAHPLERSSGSGTVLVSLLCAEVGFANADGRYC